VEAGISRHLAEEHKVKPGLRRDLLQYMRSSESGIEIASSIEDVARPPDGLAPVAGLPIHDGFECTDRGGNCRRYLSISLPAMKRHCRVVHKASTGAKGRPPLGRSRDGGNNDDCCTTAAAGAAGYRRVKLQTLWTQKKHVDYFIVQPQVQAAAGGRNGGQGESQQRRKSIDGAAAEGLQARYTQVQKDRLEQYGTVQKLAHVSEDTPWLRATGYQAHLEGLDVEEFAPSYKLPVAEDEPVLSLICTSVGRVLRKSMDVLSKDDPGDRQLSRLNAKLLNTFRRAEMSQDPIKPLQNKQTQESYIRTWQQLACYFARLASKKYLSHRKKMFVATPEQLAAWERMAELAAGEVEVAAAAADGGAGAAAGGGSEEKSKGKKRQRVAWCERTEAEQEMDGRLDGCALRFSMALIQQRLGGRAFDSPIISFAAITAWDVRQNAWMKVNYYTSRLSQLIYDGQLVVLQHCLGLVERRGGGEEAAAAGGADLTECLVDVRDKWLLNDTPGPIGELLSTRLLGRQISENTVEAAQLRWHADGETIVYKDVSLSMRDIRNLVRHELAAARAAFAQDLCFGLDGVPSYPVERIVDNWDAQFAGASFITDARNATLLADGTSWLFNQAMKNTELMDVLLHKNSDGQWRVRSDAAKQYEDAVERFLEHLMLAVHVGSGQPGRRREFLGMRWCNRQADERSIFVHDGYVLFILSYHKSINLTNASRFPVRMLMPEIGELLVRYLVLIQPFRAWLAHDTKIPAQVSEYLWADGAGEVWTRDRMSRVFSARVKAAIGVKLGIRSWRQMAVGIATKKFGGAGCDEVEDEVLRGGGDGDEDDNDDSGDDDGGRDGGGDGGASSSGGRSSRRRSRGAGLMPDAFHWQAAHTPRTGNQAYGGTVNFRQGLTDAALQEYLHISQMWHRFLAVRTDAAKHGRQQSDGPSGGRQAPLAKRIACRRDAGWRRCRRNWSMAEARVALEQMYGPGAKYKTAKQEEAVQAVVSGISPVIAVLGTGEGKSLLYMLPQRLPGAGTTVLVVPLVVLKKDTVRRCGLLGVECRVWGTGGPARGLGNALVMVSLDQAVGVTFQTYLRRLEAAGQLQSIVIDESHLILTASTYRACMERVQRFRGLACQLVFLTATLPMYMLNSFVDRLLLAKPVVIRGLTVRRDIQYEVLQCTGPDLIPEAVEAIKVMLRADWFMKESGARAIAYCRLKEQVDAVGAALGCPVYYSDSGTDEEKGKVLEAWLRGGDGEGDEGGGTPRIVVATSAFGAGIDYPAVRVVFHVGEPDGAVGFAQEVGRGGRDGNGSISCAILPREWRAKARDASGELLSRDVVAMQRYLDSPRCRVVPLSEFLDEVAQFCDQHHQQVPCCDRCRELGLLSREEAGDLARESGRRQQEEGAGEEIGGEGVLMLRACERTEQRLRDEFIGNLRMVEGKCTICCMAAMAGEGLVEGVRGGMGHSLSDCRSAKKREFFAAKKRAMARVGGWMAPYSGCFRCGLPQGVCERQGQEGCRYRDVVMPLSWAGFGVGGIGRKLVEGLAGRTFSSEEEYMAWLGKGRTVFGEQGSNMAHISAAVLARLTRWLVFSSSSSSS
jgi:superfamily II DNA helicase RecQ